jgi:hypothetical protein
MFKIEQHLGPLEQVPCDINVTFLHLKSGHFSRRVARIPGVDRDRTISKILYTEYGSDERRIDFLWHFLAKKLLEKSGKFSRRVARGTVLRARSNACSSSSLVLKL